MLFRSVSIGSYPWMKPGQFGTAIVVSGLDAAVTTSVARTVEAEVRTFGAEANIVNADGTLAD